MIDRLLLLIVVLVLAGCAGNAERHVLIYTKNGKGYVHKNIPASIEALKKICRRNGWTFVSTDRADVFDQPGIKDFDAMVFSNTNNETFDTQAQKTAFQEYMKNGGGFVGIHSACGSEREWPWFWANLGGKFLRHPKLQAFDIRIIDGNHPSTRFLGSTWKWDDECYFMHHLNPDIHVLLAADLTTVEDAGKHSLPGTMFGRTFPLCWCHEFDGGRQWYTALGHKPEHYEDETFIKHLDGGIRWVMKINE